MLSKIRPWHHVVVGIVIAVMALLAGVRVIGAGDDACSAAGEFRLEAGHDVAGG